MLRTAMVYTFFTLVKGLPDQRLKKMLFIFLFDSLFIGLSIYCSCLLTAYAILRFSRLLNINDNLDKIYQHCWCDIYIRIEDIEVAPLLKKS